MQVLRAPCTKPVRPSPARPRLAVVTAASVQTESAPASTSAAPSNEGAEIYIGFVKEEGFGSREGKKGRVIKDDPRKYPGREDLGPLPSVVGGWAGGEVGLWKIREEALAAKAKAKKPTVQAPPPATPVPGKDPIYVGFSKDELELRKSGAKGRIVYDDPTKYPGREDIGPLPSAVGGFAAGEVGLRQFIETGELKLRDPNTPGKKQFSPLTVAGAMIVLGAGGGVLLDKAFNAGEGIVKTEILSAPIDNNTKTLILVGAGLVAASTAIAATQTALKSLQEKVQESAKQIAVTSAFGLAVFLAARAVLESQ